MFIEHIIFFGSIQNFEYKFESLLDKYKRVVQMSVDRYYARNCLSLNFDISVDSASIQLSVAIICKALC